MAVHGSINRIYHIISAPPEAPVVRRRRLREETVVKFTVSLEVLVAPSSP